MNSTKKYYIGTKAQCEAYNSKVVSGENYDLTTTKRWADSIECVGYWAILSNEDYLSEMSSVDILDRVIIES